MESLEEFREIIFKKAYLKSNDELFKQIAEKLKKEEYEKFELFFIDNKKDLDKEFERFDAFVDSWDLIILDNSDVEKILKNDKEIQEIIQDLFEYPPKYQILYKKSSNEIFVFEFIKKYNQILVNVFIFKLPLKIYIVSDY
jgi:predicted O-methyltransferase YrrM